MPRTVVNQLVNMAVVTQKIDVLVVVVRGHISA